MNTNVKNKFTGRYLDMKPLGLMHIKLKDRDEHYTIDRPNSCVKNLIMGTTYVEHIGTQTVTNHKTGEMVICTYHSEGWGGKNKHLVEGVYKKNKDDKSRQYILTGKWSE
mmetsp:Transcript_64325/g.88989  ORF Transcript_64325/g.88989 Transcript_64325/m.88989 type:complete len:110 (-) Transcript_64325:123-452(-)